MGTLYNYQKWNRPTSRNDTLERMLNKTTLSVQRVTHRHIIERGQLAFVQTTSEESYDKEKAVQIALEQAEIRFARELKFALSRLRVEKEEGRLSALKAQKEYYEKHMARVAEQRDELEEERLRELRRQFDIEKESALSKLETRLKAEATQALENAREEEREHVRNDLLEEHERNIREALRRCEDEARCRLANAVENVKMECEREKVAALNAEKARHSREIDAKNEVYDHLFSQLERSLKYNRQLERDYQCLQHEYKRFLDNTDGHFHSDYMLNLRKHGIQLSRKGLPIVEMEDVADLKKVLESK